ncbi:universal stress protein [Neptunicoccus cionae]|uniref:Universal stress protein F n=1 Tax=Neptunicoccus cionae TaxID=2035344 RepID=A0A916R229_9RHOB|nr:universal stress protein [Amylibacter cionae]GGA28220.1 universal stress protein F [Amylibacter cionae]
MFNTVLLTIDLTDKDSWVKALPQAIELVSSSGGVLHIISVVPDMGSPLVEGFFPENFEEKAVAEASKALDKLVRAEIPNDVKVKQHLAFGKIHRKVLKTIEKINCDLVVMASHKPDRLREFLVGSNADRIVSRSPVSVLVVRA